MRKLYGAWAAAAGAFVTLAPLEQLLQRARCPSCAAVSRVYGGIRKHDNVSEKRCVVAALPAAGRLGQHSLLHDIIAILEGSFKWCSAGAHNSCTLCSMLAFGVLRGRVNSSNGS